MTREDVNLCSYILTEKLPTLTQANLHNSLCNVDVAPIKLSFLEKYVSGYNLTERQILSSQLSVLNCISTLKYSSKGIILTNTPLYSNELKRFAAFSFHVLESCFNNEKNTEKSHTNLIIERATELILKEEPIAAIVIEDIWESSDLAKAEWSKLDDFSSRNGVEVLIDATFRFPRLMQSDSEKITLNSRHIHAMVNLGQLLSSPSLNCCLLLSNNTDDNLTRALDYWTDVAPVSPISRQTVCSLLEDKTWFVERYLATLFSELDRRYDMIKSSLSLFDNQIHLHRQNFALWCNFSQLLSPENSEKSETEFIQHFPPNLVTITQGRNLEMTESGWLRIWMAGPISILHRDLNKLRKYLLEVTSGNSDNYVITDCGDNEHVTMATTREEAAPKESVESLLGSLMLGIKSDNSNWLKENTAERWIDENPNVAQEFLSIREDFLRGSPKP